jgi:hypothetical protein
MQVKSKHPLVIKPKQPSKLSKPKIQDVVTPYERANKQISLLATDNMHFCVYGYN